MKFEWTEEYADSFEQLKLLFTNAPILNIMDLEKEFVICIDACKRGLCGVLMQEGQVVCYVMRLINR